MELRKFDKTIINNYYSRIIGLIDEVLDINGVLVDKDYSPNLVSEMGNYLDDNSAYIVGAFDEDQLIGFIWCYKRIYNQQERLHIYHFIVDESYRGLGIGKELINNVFDYCKESEISKIDLMATASNKKVLSFYYKNGFTDERVLLSKSI